MLNGFAGAIYKVVFAMLYPILAGFSALKGYNVGFKEYMDAMSEAVDNEYPVKLF